MFTGPFTKEQKKKAEAFRLVQIRAEKLAHSPLPINAEQAIERMQTRFAIISSLVELVQPKQDEYGFRKDSTDTPIISYFNNQDKLMREEEENAAHLLTEDQRAHMGYLRKQATIKVVTKNIEMHYPPPPSLVYTGKRAPNSLIPPERHAPRRPPFKGRGKYE